MARSHPHRIWGVSRRRTALGLAAGLLLVLSAALPAVVQAGEGPSGRRMIAPLVPGDEPIVVTEHTVQTAKGPLTYEARAGRLAIRDAQTGEVHAHMFFVAYVVKTESGTKRPLTIAWNGGPGGPSSLIHMQGMGPRRTAGDHMIDNAETLLATSDLVFMDAVGTGFSRVEDQRFAAEFYNLRGDIAATAEFIRAYRARFRAGDQPLFIAGESYGVFRAAGVADLLTDRGERLAGAILVSGDIPNIPQPVAFYDAMHVPARTAAAFYYNRLPPDLMHDRAATLKAVNAWAVDVYQPALERIDTLAPEEKDKIAADLARYIGLRPDQIDHKTLVVHAFTYLHNFFGGDMTKTLAGHDMRETAEDAGPLENGGLVDRYLRDDLGYVTDLPYLEGEGGYAPSPGPKPTPAGVQFNYDLWMPAADIANTEQYGDVTWIARAMPRFIPVALERDKALRVFVATGRFDPLNMCEGDVRVTAQLPSDQASRIINVCYEGGHVMYRDPQARVAWLDDIARFERQTLQLQGKGANAQARPPQ